ncbi:MAG: hypothetical protein ACM3L9_01745 [Deltaproteobacteria bacterium]
MKRLNAKAALAALVAIGVAGCADGSTGVMTTSALGPDAAAKADPACATLAARIDALRKEGVVATVEKASASKSKNVSVNRETLAKVAELDRANAEFQSKCALPTTAAAAQPPAAKTAAAAPAPAAAATKKQ